MKTKGCLSCRGREGGPTPSDLRARACEGQRKCTWPWAEGRSQRRVAVLACYPDLLPRVARASLQGSSRLTSLGTVVILVSRAVSTSCADGQPGPARRGGPSDADVRDPAPSTEVGRQAPLPLLQRRPAPAAALELVPRVPDPHCVERRLRAVLVPGRDGDSKCHKEKPEISHTCAE